MARFPRTLLATALTGVTFLPSAPQPRPLLTKVEHFYLVSDESEKLYNFFRDELRLPVVWAFNTYGSFASGGLTLGNVVIEFVREGRFSPTSAAEFKGIAFEPAGDAEAAAGELERRGVAYGDLIPFKYTQGGQERVGWVTIDLKGFPPAGNHIFICDYKDRERVAEGRRRASSELATNGGGPLGVTSLKELVVGVKSVRDASAAWRKLLDAPAGTDPVFAFGPGPKVRLVTADADGIQSIVIGVKSAARAREFLADRKMLGGDGGQLRINPAAVGGLNIILVEE